MYRLIFFAFLLISTLPAFSIDKIETEKVLELVIENTVPWELGNYCVQPFFMRFEPDNENLLKISVVHYTFQTIVILEYNLYLNLKTGEITRQNDIDPIWDSPLPVSVKSPVMIENGTPIVEGFQLPKRYFDYAVLSPDKNFLATEERQALDDFNYTVHGVILWKINYQEVILDNWYDETFDLSFLKSENYFYCRGNKYHTFGDFFISEDEYEERATLETTLIRLSDLKQFETHGDIAFTADERYFVTERELMPTLVDAQTDQNLLQYNMPVRLVAAVFSPDQKQLFLTGTDNKLYVFDSHLPAGVGEWMLQ